MNRRADQCQQQSRCEVNDERGEQRAWGSSVNFYLAHSFLPLSLSLSRSMLGNSTRRRKNTNTINRFQSVTTFVDCAVHTFTSRANEIQAAVTVADRRTSLPAYVWAARRRCLAGRVAAFDALEVQSKCAGGLWSIEDAAFGSFNVSWRYGSTSNTVQFMIEGELM